MKHVSATNIHRLTILLVLNSSLIDVDTLLNLVGIFAQDDDHFHLLDMHQTLKNIQFKTLTFQ